MKNNQCHEKLSVIQPPMGRSEGGEPADDCRSQYTLAPCEKGERRGEHHRDHGAAQKALRGPERNHALNVPRDAAEQARSRKARRRHRKQPAR